MQSFLLIFTHDHLVPGHWVNKKRRCPFFGPYMIYYKNVIEYLLKKEIGKMFGSFIDFNDDDFCLSLSDELAVDSEGDTMMKLSDNLAVDLETGETHAISGWTDDD